MQITEVQCDCPECVRMCGRAPCWPTPEEARALLDAGYGDRLIVDYWANVDPETYDRLGQDILVLCGHGERFTLPCGFLTKEGKCELHELGLKPVEGRIADCKNVGRDSPREWIKDLWNTPEAQAMARQAMDEYDLRFMP